MSDKVVKLIACPRCGSDNSVTLDAAEKCARGLLYCRVDACGQAMAYDVSRMHTKVAAVPELTIQPNRRRHEKAPT